MSPISEDMHDIFHVIWVRKGLKKYAVERLGIVHFNLVLRDEKKSECIENINE